MKRERSIKNGGIILAVIYMGKVLAAWAVACADIPPCCKIPPAFPPGR
jgi:hypothetical protein